MFKKDYSCIKLILLYAMGFNALLYFWQWVIEMFWGCYLLLKISYCLCTGNKEKCSITFRVGLVSWELVYFCLYCLLFLHLFCLYCILLSDAVLYCAFNSLSKVQSTFFYFLCFSSYAWRAYLCSTWIKAGQTIPWQLLTAPHLDFPRHRKQSVFVGIHICTTEKMPS